MVAKEYLEALNATLGLNLYQMIQTLILIPESQDELELHMQLSYKQSIEIAEEEAISNVLAAKQI